MKELAGFHTAHKMLIMAHSARHYREMGALVGSASSRPIRDVYADYDSSMLSALRGESS
ncbi:MAG TPA: DUF1722 domain-containing protein [Spirochaetia bacterium]|nr:DUF1722 domain-containing protein [Spirochaetia bacterium]